MFWAGWRSQCRHIAAARLRCSISGRHLHAAQAVQALGFDIAPPIWPSKSGANTQPGPRLARNQSATGPIHVSGWTRLKALRGLDATKSASVLPVRQSARPPAALVSPSPADPSSKPPPPHQPSALPRPAALSHSGRRAWVWPLSDAFLFLAESQLHMSLRPNRRYLLTIFRPLRWQAVS
jgi:hypothetical protein